MKKLMCESCGSTDLEKQEGFYVCNACGTKIVVEEEKEDDIPIEECIVISDFSFDEKACLLSVKEWLIEDDYSPDDILVNSKIGPLERVYIPMYAFGGEYTANWSADSGYNREEIYTDYEKRTVNGRTVTEPVTKKRTVTDWRPSSGVVTGSFAQLSSANTQIEKKLTEHLETTVKFPYEDYTTLANFEKEGKCILPFETSESAAFKSIKHRIDSRIENKVCSNIPGDTYRDAKWTSNLSHDKTIQLYYPAYIGSYEYNGTSYPFIVDGKDVDNLFGTRPRDTGRVEKVKKSAELMSNVSIATNMLSVLTVIFMFMFGIESIGFFLLCNLAFIGLSIYCYCRCLETVKQVAIKQKARRIRMLNILHNDNLSDDEKDKQLSICTYMEISPEELAKYSSSKNLDTLNVGINYEIKDKAFNSMLVSFIGPAIVVVFGFFPWLGSL